MVSGSAKMYWNSSLCLCAVCLSVEYILSYLNLMCCLRYCDKHYLAYGMIKAQIVCTNFHDGKKKIYALIKQLFINSCRETYFSWECNFLKTIWTGYWTSRIWMWVKPCVDCGRIFFKLREPEGGDVREIQKHRERQRSSPVMPTTRF